MKQTGIGVIGCGNISDVYIKNLSIIFSNTKVVAVTDIFREKAVEKAEKFGIPCVCKNVEELLAQPEVEIVLILTLPHSHAALAKASLEAGKHTYVEKPYAYTRAEARALVELAKRKGLYFSSAPDTALGAVVQTGRKLIEDGWIGDIIGASMSSSFGSPETWHPNPDFFYKAGAGPLYDNGPYAVLAMAYLLGPFASVSCAGRKTYEYRTITSKPRYGEKITVEVPTFLQCVMTFESGAISTAMFSCDTCNEKLQENGFEIYGSLGTLVLSHPSKFGGKVLLKTRQMEQWQEIPLLSCYSETMRGVGVADMAYAIENHLEPRLSTDLVYHVVDAMISIDEAWQTGQTIRIESTFQKTRPLPMGVTIGNVELE
ncbi:MAG: Gfo/Idh/MocA family oxidoreductase [Clostridia bacterium]